MKKSNNTFFSFLSHYLIPEPITEHKFHETRKWRFDYAWVEQRLALEVEGGVWTGGRHTRGAGFVKDMEKYNAASADGWRIVRVEPSKLLSIETIKILKKCLTLKD